MKQQFLENGGDNYYPHQLLEMLLFYTIPRIDTNPVAHRLLKQFGDLESVMNSGIVDLKEINGIGPASACFISAVGEICRRYFQSCEERISFANFDDLKSYFSDNFPDHSTDSLLIISINPHLELIHSESISLNELSDSSTAARLIAGIILKGGSDRIAARI